MKKRIDYCDSLPDVMNYFNHRGLIVEKLIGGFRWQGKVYLSISELEADRDFICKAIDKSIINEDTIGNT